MQIFEVFSSSLFTDFFVAGDPVLCCFFLFSYLHLWWLLLYFSANSLGGLIVYHILVLPFCFLCAFFFALFFPTKCIPFLSSEPALHLLLPKSHQQCFQICPVVSFAVPWHLSKSFITLIAFCSVILSWFTLDGFYYRVMFKSMVLLYYFLFLVDKLSVVFQACGNR